MIRFAGIKSILVVMLLAQPVVAQTSGKLSFSGRAVYHVPIGSLHDLFTPASGFSFTCGQRTDDNWIWEGSLEFARFTKGNTSRLYYPDLSLKLDLYGAGVQAHYYLFGKEGIVSGVVHPFLSGAASTYRWFYSRGSYVIDSTKGAAVPMLSQQDWSLGIRAGGGMEVQAMSSLALVSQVSYNAVIGELWPTLALRIVGVSVFQMVEVFLGIRYFLQ